VILYSVQCYAFHWTDNEVTIREQPATRTRNTELAETAKVIVTDTFLLTCFFLARELRDRSLEHDREVRRTRELCVAWWQAGRSVLFGPFGRKDVFFFLFLFAILVCV